MKQDHHYFCTIHLLNVDLPPNGAACGASRLRDSARSTLSSKNSLDETLMTVESGSRVCFNLVQKI
jgi:hypothetical protein